MKKFVLAALAMMLLASKSDAAMKTYEKGNSTATVQMVICSTDTVIELDPDALIPGKELYGFRLTNLDATYDAYIGFDVATTTDSDDSSLGTSNLGGVPIPANKGSAVFPVNDDVSVYCIAEDGAGADGVALALEAYGH